MHPLSTVEETGFLSLLYKLDPKYGCPSSKHFSEKELPQLYTHEQYMKVKPQMDEISHFSDFWTSTLRNPYLSLTTHCIDKEWNLNLETTAPLTTGNGMAIKKCHALVETFIRSWI